METVANPLLNLIFYVFTQFISPALIMPAVPAETHIQKIPPGTPLPALTMRLVKNENNCPKHVAENKFPLPVRCLEPEIQVSDKDILKAFATRNAYGRSAIMLHLTTHGSRKFAAVTRKYRTRKLAIIYNRRIITAPVIREQIPGGKIQISGNFTSREAHRIAGIINAAAEYARRNSRGRK